MIHTLNVNYRSQLIRDKIYFLFTQIIEIIPKYTHTLHFLFFSNSFIEYIFSKSHILNGILFCLPISFYCYLFLAQRNCVTLIIIVRQFFLCFFFLFSVFKLSTNKIRVFIVVVVVGLLHTNFNHIFIQSICSFGTLDFCL